MSGRFGLTLAFIAAVASCTANPLSSAEANPQTVKVDPTAYTVPVVPPLPNRPITDRAAYGDTLEIKRAALQQGGFVLLQAPANINAVTYNSAALPMDSDGNLFIAFDRDAPLEQSLTMTFADGRTEAMPITLTAGGWRIENVNAPMKGGAKSNADYEARRNGELAQINAARKIDSGSFGWAQQFIWPVKGRISGWFGAQRVYQGQPGSYHGGVDVAMPTGTVIVAPADGVVILAADNPFTLEGNLLMIDHGNGLNSAFLHNSVLLVDEGQVVRQGDPIAKIGATGRASGPHMHWGMKWHSARIDPKLFAGPM